MAIPIIIPRLGWNMEEGTFLGWLKPDGATIKPGDVLFTLESDKSTEEIECLDTGILRIAVNGPREGDRLPVGAVIGHLVREGETVDAATPVADPAPSMPRTPRSRPAPETIPFARQPSETTPAISPRARRVATELGVDWTNLKGSGSTGRIRECDVREAHREQPQRPPSRTIRKIIAERMLASHLSTAPVTLTSRADATNLVSLRSQFKAAGGDVVPSLTDFLVKLTAIALKIHPQLNSRWVDDDVELVLDEVHIGIAVDTDAGLLVPVVRDVPHFSLRQLAAHTRDLIDRAKGARLKTHEMQGGTFTITNLGALGIDAFTPIINQPECAILGIGAVRREPAVEGDHVVIRDRMVLSLTFDHRVVDGAPAAKFLQTLVRSIENPSPWLMT